VLSRSTDGLLHRLLVGLAASIAVLGLADAQASPASAADRARVEIINDWSGLRADVIWGSTSPFQGVFLWPDNASTSQEFDLLDSGGGYFRIRARHSGQCLMLDWRSGPYTNGTRVIQYPHCAAGYSPAEWSIRSLSDVRCFPDGTCQTAGLSYELLVNRLTDRCLDAHNPAGGAPPVEAVLQQWDCVTSNRAWNLSNQSWSILEPGRFRL
jgi:hypothetical protein